MTRRQKQVYDFIREYWSEHGQSPTYAEITKFMGNKSKSSAHLTVARLDEQGWLRIVHGKKRSIMVLIPRAA